MLSFLVRRSLRPRYSKIATEIYVSNEWLEFACEKPLRPRGCTQRISLKIPGYECHDYERDFDIRLANGKVAQPTIEVVDSSGHVFEAKDSTRIGNLVGFRVVEDIRRNLFLSDDRQSVTVRIRSDEAFGCESIDWVTTRMK